MRYFFNVRDGDSFFRDAEGITLRDHADILLHARQFAHFLAFPATTCPSSQSYIEVTTASGDLAASLSLASLAMEPALGSGNAHRGAYAAH